MKSVFCRLFSRFSDTTGAVTAEFVIIFPVVIALLFLIVLISMMVSVASDVQQLAHDLARQAYGELSTASPAADVCDKLRQEVLPRLLNETLLLSAQKVTLLPCPGLPETGGRIAITVTYNFGGDFVQGLARSFGIDLGLISRSSVTFI